MCMLRIVFPVRSSFFTNTRKTDELCGVTSSILCFAQEGADYPTKHNIQI
jgi:hypothetical protein